MKYTKLSILTILFLGQLLFTGNVLAVQQNPGQIINNIGSSAELSTTTTLPQIIGSVIAGLLGLLALLLLGMIIYSGVQYMNAGGDEENTKTAMTRIKNATIGLLIVMASYAIANFVIDLIETAVNVSA